MRLAGTGTCPDGRYPLRAAWWCPDDIRMGRKPMTAAGAMRPASAAVMDALSTPPFASVTNGLRAVSWTPLLDATAPVTLLVLDRLTQSAIAACVASTGGADRLRRGWTARQVRLWVDVARHTDAQDVARAVLTELASRRR